MTGDSSPAGGAVPLIDPADFARMVRDASDEQLRDGLAVNRELILGEIFRRMAEHLRADRAEGLDAVVEWRILDSPGDEGHRWQVAIRDGWCNVAAGGEREPRVIFSLGPVDFIRLVTGHASGPKLFLVGRLKVEGDLVLAARMPVLFAIPEA
jgi:predicted lipid carrier protein YhbT